MARFNTYIRKALESPLSRYSQENKKERGTLINDLLEKFLKRKGYL